MKKLGIIIVSVCIIANVLIGIWLYSDSSLFLNEKNESQNKVSGNLSDSKLVPYFNSVYGFSFLYPRAWVINTTKELKENDISLVESFGSVDASDGFFEGMFVNAVKFKSDLDFDSVLNSIRASVPEVFVDSPREIAGYKSQELVMKKFQKSGSTDYEVRSHAYLVKTSKDLILFEFVDQLSTYDANDKKFVEVINSIKF